MSNTNAFLQFLSYPRHLPSLRGYGKWNFFYKI